MFNKADHSSNNGSAEVRAVRNNGTSMFISDRRSVGRKVVRAGVNTDQAG